MTQFTCKGVKQINNRISFKHLYHLYISAFFISAGVPNGEFPEILIAKCRSRFYCTWFFCWGEIVREINVSRAGDPVHAGDKAGLTGMLLRDLIWVISHDKFDYSFCGRHNVCYNFYVTTYIFRNLVVYIVTSQIL